jgi:hypothetical protein
MIEQHYAGVIANWDGKQLPADKQIGRARPRSRRALAHLRLLYRRCDRWPFAPAGAEAIVSPVGLIYSSEVSG